MATKLIVSNRIEFDVRFTLNDGGEEKPFGIRLSAERQPLDKYQAEMKTGMTVGEFLKARGVSMKAWIDGKSPLVDDVTNEAIPPGPDALQALHELIGGMTSLIHLGYLEANGAKGRAGN